MSFRLWLEADPDAGGAPRPSTTSTPRRPAACACASVDAHRCAAIRYGRPPSSRTDDPCDCDCHDNEDDDR